MDIFKCNACKRDLPLDRQHFCKDPTTKTGFRYRCKECDGHWFKPIPRDGFKICAKCGAEFPKNTDYFYTLRNGVLKHICKECSKLYIKERNNENKEYRVQYSKEYHQKNKKKILAYQKQYISTHKEKVRKTNNICKKRWRAENINVRLVDNMRNRIWYALRGGTKSASTMELIGCSADDLWKHLESQFEKGMTKENYGFGDDKWHVDHIIPPPYFDLEDPEQQRKCFNYINLRPMWQPFNISKNSWYNGVKYHYKKPVSK